MAHELSELYAFLLFLFYGLVFFTTGVAITSKVTRGSKLTIARYLPLFAIFAFVHACHEWMVLFLELEWSTLPREWLPFISRLRLVPITISYVFLLLFGFFVLQAVYPKTRRILQIIAFSLPVVLIFWLLSHGIESTPDFFRFAAFRVRNLLGFPGALAAGLGLIGYAGTIRDTSGKVARNFTGAGAALIVYGVFAGLIPTGTVLPLLGARIELLRGISALFILHFMMNALHIFDLEREALLEERLQRFAQSEKLTSLGKLAAGIAHEINNPLTNVSINVEMLRRELPQAADAPLSRRFEAIERNIDRASRIAKELLDFARHREAEFVTAELNAVIRSTLILLGARRSEYDIRLEAGDLPAIRAVPWKLEEVFLNVLINAMEASSPGGAIIIRTFTRDGAVIAEVEDHGCGMPPEIQRSMFDPFFTTKEVGKGTGLGLSICFGIMEAHGGRIEVKSAFGHGTTVSLIFPLPQEG